jgi:hypothetical protein
MDWKKFEFEKRIFSLFSLTLSLSLSLSARACRVNVAQLTSRTQKNFAKPDFYRFCVDAFLLVVVVVVSPLSRVINYLTFIY